MFSSQIIIVITIVAIIIITMPETLPTPSSSFTTARQYRDELLAAKDCRVVLTVPLSTLCDMVVCCVDSGRNYLTMFRERIPNNIPRETIPYGVLRTSVSGARSGNRAEEGGGRGLLLSTMGVKLAWRDVFESIAFMRIRRDGHAVSGGNEEEGLLYPANGDAIMDMVTQIQKGKMTFVDPLIGLCLDGLHTLASYIPWGRDPDVRRCWGKVVEFLPPWPASAMGSLPGGRSVDWFSGRVFLLWAMRNEKGLIGAMLRVEQEGFMNDLGFESRRIGEGGEGGGGGVDGSTSGGGGRSVGKRKTTDPLLDFVCAYYTSVSLYVSNLLKGVQNQDFNVRSLIKCLASVAEDRRFIVNESDDVVATVSFRWSFMCAIFEEHARRLKARSDASRKRMMAVGRGGGGGGNNNDNGEGILARRDLVRLFRDAEYASAASVSRMSSLRYRACLLQDQKKKKGGNASSLSIPSSSSSAKNGKRPRTATPYNDPLRYLHNLAIGDGDRALSAGLLKSQLKSDAANVFKGDRGGGGGRDKKKAKTGVVKKKDVPSS